MTVRGSGQSTRSSAVFPLRMINLAMSPASPGGRLGVEAAFAGRE
jgi:hypothetical protein